MPARKTLLYRLFGAGKMPEAVRSEISGETVLFETEGIRVALHRRGRVPGVVAAGRSVNIGWGGFAVTDRRVIGSRGRAKWVDVPFDAVSADGPATLVLDTTGLHVRFDLARVHPSCSGEMSMDFREELTATDLERFPALELTFSVDPQKVVRVFGSLKKLPA
jgi:hypothetical protein